MASTVVLVLLVSLFYRAVLSLPISQDTLVQSDSVDVESSKRIVDIDPVVVLTRDIELVNDPGVSFEGVLQRTKRDVIKVYHPCPQGMKWFYNMCVTLEK